MAISLEKPLGTDIYNVGVFNSNSTIIEDALNPLITDIETVKNQLLNKLDYEQVIGDLDLSTISGNKIYFVTGDVTTDVPVDNLPSGGNIVICYNYDDNIVKTLISGDGRLFQKNSTEDIWKALTSTVIDNLTTDDSYSSLSAKQGKILNDTKLSITILAPEDLLDLDDASNGIYIGGSNIIKENITSETALPVEEPKDFVFVSLGLENESCIQYFSVSTTDDQKTYRRYGYTTLNDDGSKSYSFSLWRDTDASGGGSSGDDLTDRVSALETRAVTMTLTQV